MHGKTRQCTTKHDNARQNTTNTTKHDNVRQNTTNHDKTRQNTTKHDKTRPRTTMNENARPNTKQHSTKCVWISRSFVDRSPSLHHSTTPSLLYLNHGLTHHRSNNDDKVIQDLDFQGENPRIPGGRTLANF